MSFKSSLPPLIFYNLDVIFCFFFLVRGVANESQAGVVSSIAQQAAKMFPAESETPTICLESDGRYVLIMIELPYINRGLQPGKPGKVMNNKT